MQKSDSGTETQAAKISTVEEKNMAAITDPYIREQLLKRQEELTLALEAISAVVDVDPFQDLLHEVGSAIQRIDEGSYGICDECHDSIEKDRLIADPLVRLCLDHLTDDGRRALERDIELAARIQRGLLPQAETRFRDWRIQYQYNPAGMVSGDYCDLISPTGGGANTDGKLIFLLGDVAGKGVAASLLMTHLHAMFRTLSGLGLELDKLIETANRVFCESTIAGQYATLICGRAGRQGEIEITSAGHFPALVVTKDGVRQISATGLPLGMFSTSQYTVQRVRLEPGDSLLLYTDGISEANNPAGKEYGVAGIMRVAEERHGWAPHELMAACLKDVHNFSSGAPAKDDQTLMILHRTDSAGLSLGE
jgi:phosphoserine phosphatase RsbU/P